MSSHRRSRSRSTEISLEEKVHQVITGMARSQSFSSLQEKFDTLQDTTAAAENARTRRLKRRDDASSQFQLDPIKVVAGRTSPLPNQSNPNHRYSNADFISYTALESQGSTALSYIPRGSVSKSVITAPIATSSAASTVAKEKFKHRRSASESSSAFDSSASFNTTPMSNHSSHIPRAPASKSVAASPVTPIATALAKEKFKHRRTSSTEIPRIVPPHALSINTSSPTSTKNTDNPPTMERSSRKLRSSSIDRIRSSSPESNANNNISRSSITSKLPPASRSKIVLTPTAPVPVKTRPHFTRSRSASPIKSSSSSSSHLQPQLRKQKSIDYKQRTFQKPQDQMKLYVAVMDHSSRCIFPSNSQQYLPPQLAQLARKATTSVQASTALTQVSPSLQLCTLRRYLNSQTHRRQLIWSPTVSPEADPFHGWNNDVELKEQQGEDGGGLAAPSSPNQQQHKKRVGRYYPMLTSEYVQSKLPPHPPLLSIRKHRLPMRTDVGFSRPTADEVLKKQEEIQREASWEEACPRLAVLLSTRDVGEFCQLRKVLDKHGAAAAMAAQKERNNSQKSANIHNNNLSGMAPISFFDDVVMAPITRNRKPNSASVFAPPLESVPAGRGWKPRPVSDRPLGLRYALIDPIKVTFEAIGDMEPLVCTLALYTARGWCKISEDFSFPAGEWKDYFNVKDDINASAFDVEVNSPITVSSSPLSTSATSASGLLNMRKWWRQKALFSYDPMAHRTAAGDSKAAQFPEESHEDIYLVLKVFKVAHEGALAPYLSDSAKKHLTPIKNLSRRFGSNKKATPHHEIENCRSKAWSFFSHFGTQFLTPICFGAAPLFASIDFEQNDGVHPLHRWPGDGCTQTFDLFAFPTQATTESSDALAERLSFLYEHEILKRPVVQTINEDLSCNVVSPLSDKVHHQGLSSISSSKVKGLIHRSGFKSNVPEKAVDEGSSSAAYLEAPLRLTGNATIISAYLGADFTKVLQLTATQPSTVDDRMQGVSPIPFPMTTVAEVSGEEETSSGKVLVDVMGDCAVASRDRLQSKEAGNSFSKRSDRSHIVRLARSQNPAGYIDSADIREILFLPPVNCPGCFESSSLLSPDVNLLFLYPRVLTLADSVDNKENMKLHSGANKSYSIQIRLLQDNNSQSHETSSEALDAIYNPAPGCPTLLKVVCTKICPKTLMGKMKLSENVFLQDEVKIRLPTVLDNSYRLHFTLVSITLRSDERTRSDCSVLGQVEVIGSAELPLLNIQTKESASKMCVSTILPNKLHQVKLGSFCLALETRVMSSLHIPDPSTVAVLRDFPIAQTGEPVPPQLYLIGNCPFSDIVDNSSSSDLMRHFDILMYIHFRNFILTNRIDYDFSRIIECFPEHGVIGMLRHDGSAFCESRSLLEALRSLLAVLEKVKSFFFPLAQIDHISSLTVQQRRMNLFFKRFLDLYEEEVIRRDDAFLKDLCLDHERVIFSSDGIANIRGSLSSSDKKGSSVIPSGDSVDEFNFDYLLDLNFDSTEDNTIHPSIRKIGQRSRRTVDNDLKNLVQYSKSSRDTPFSRRAYGVSKLHRMRLEAELGEDSSFRHLSPENHFYDDSTIITTATWHDLLSEKTEGFLRINNEEQRQQLDKVNISNAFEPIIHGSLNNHTLARHNEQPTVKKSRSPYSIFIAPCVGAPHYEGVAPFSERRPSFDVVSPLNDRGSSFQLKSATPTPPVSELSSKKVQSMNKLHGCCPGSDIEDESDDGSSGEQLSHQMQRKSVASGGFWVHPEATKNSRLRGSLRHVVSGQMTLSIGEPGKISDDSAPPFLYESILLLWLRVWLESLCSTTESSMFCNLSISFIDCIEFFAPLCLKSIALRFSDVVSKNSESSSKLSTGKSKLSPLLLDKNHMKLLTSIAIVWAQSIICRTTAKMKDNEEDDSVILLSLYSCDAVIDFFVGMMPMVHIAQTSILIQTFLQSLKALETVDYRSSLSLSNIKTSVKAIHVKRIIVSRHLRLRLIDKLGCLPCFVAINYPMKYPSFEAPIRFKFPKWTHQLPDNFNIILDSNSSCHYPDGVIRLPRAHWLTELLADDAFTICAECCEAILSDSMDRNESMDFSKRDISRLQTLAVDGIAIIYESLIRRHAVDARYQGEEARSRIAAMLVSPVLRNALDNVHWLSRMESSQRVRVLWLLCFLHVLQEAPEFLIREQLRIFCNPQNFLLLKFVRLLKLCHGTFQGLITPQTLESSSTSSSSFEFLTPWIVQECFNILCAATNVIVDECADIIRSIPLEKKKLVSGLLNLLLSIMSTPQSSVTQLRALGGASQTIDKFGSSLFVECVGDHLQHWMRVVLTLMNSTSLSVRSIAVDFMVSLLGSTFEENGTIDEITLVILTVLPEIAAREVAMYCASGQVGAAADVECVLWPLRRAISDIEETNPVDDSRVDVQLVPFLGILCSSCQAIIDGLLLEIRLQENGSVIVGSKKPINISHDCTANDFKGKKNATSTYHKSFAMNGTVVFDADEESVYEAANSFLPETAPMQRLRWLLTLKKLHETKEQWLEAAETLRLCARTIADAIPHLKSVWRPSRFKYWRDERVSLWIPSIGADLGDNKNHEIMAFADNFLEPQDAFYGIFSSIVNPSSRLQQPTVETMCALLTKVSREAVQKYFEEGGVEALAFLRLEELVKNVMGIVESTCAVGTKGGKVYSGETELDRRLAVEESAALRKMSALLNGEMSRMAERMLFLSEDSKYGFEKQAVSNLSGNTAPRPGQYYVRLVLLGKKPTRFMESTSLPTFLEWGMPAICRVTKNVVRRAVEDQGSQTLEKRLCKYFAEPILRSLAEEASEETIIFCDQPPSETELVQSDNTKTYVIVTLLQMSSSINVDRNPGYDFGDQSMASGSKRFVFRSNGSILSQLESSNSPGSAKGSRTPCFVESVVGQRFPFALSRQRVIFTSEYVSGNDV